MPQRFRFALLLTTVVVVALVAAALNSGVSATTANVRLSNDTAGGYVSAYTLATGIPYTDGTISECAISRGRQNEPSVAIDPRNTNVVLGSSNDYCGVYQPFGATIQAPTGPIWLGYYRSENGGQSFQSSLVPGYPLDTSPFAANAHIRTATAGDPVIAWDKNGRAFFGSESSGDPAGTKKTFGDVFVAVFENSGGGTINDGKRFVRSEVVGKGSSAPNLLGRFNDKTAIEADRTFSACEGTVYFSWSVFNGNGTNSIVIARSNDHGASWSSPRQLNPGNQGAQFPDISVTGNGNVYVTWHAYPKGKEPHQIQYAKSTDCGATFGAAESIVSFETYDAQDIAAPQTPASASEVDDPLDSGGLAAGSTARDCGDFANACASGFTFFRHDTQVRSTADQSDTANEFVYIVFDPSIPGTEVPTGTTYGSIAPGTGSQEGVFFLRLNGANDTHTTPTQIDAQSAGHQLFPDISADGGVLHAIWWDSRNDASYSPARPIGNSADKNASHPSLDVFGARSTDRGATWTGKARVSDTTTNGNWEQFANRTIPFAGDYLWVSSVGSTAFVTWTDWRNTVAGNDPREGTADPDADAVDVLQCRVQFPTGAFSGDRCPHAGGIDQNIYGASAP
jgi:hypothetical protein